MYYFPPVEPARRAIALLNANRLGFRAFYHKSLALSKLVLEVIVIWQVNLGIKNGERGIFKFLRKQVEDEFPR